MLVSFLVQNILEPRAVNWLIMSKHAVDNIRKGEQTKKAERFSPQPKKPFAHLLCKLINITLRNYIRHIPSFFCHGETKIIEK